jgi:hypothetical protein
MHTFLSPSIQTSFTASLPAGRQGRKDAKKTQIFCITFLLKPD